MFQLFNVLLIDSSFRVVRSVPVPARDDAEAREQGAMLCSVFNTDNFVITGGYYGD